MIHLDTNLLIAAIDVSHPYHPDAARALNSGQPASASAVAWTEFRSKPAPPVLVQALVALLGARILVFSRSEAELAAQLFQIPGVNRSQRRDTMIAAAAILAGAELATANSADFAAFAPFGLKLFLPSRP